MRGTLPTANDIKVQVTAEEQSGGVAAAVRNARTPPAPARAPRDGHGPGRVPDTVSTRPDGHRSSNSQSHSIHTLRPQSAKPKGGVVAQIRVVRTRHRSSPHPIAHKATRERRRHRQSHHSTALLQAPEREEETEASSYPHPAAHTRRAEHPPLPAVQPFVSPLPLTDGHPSLSSGLRWEEELQEELQQTEHNSSGVRTPDEDVLSAKEAVDRP